MIDVTRLNGHRLVLNCDLVKFAEAAPDTTITLVSGEKLLVRETLDALMESIRMYRSAVLQTAWPSADVALSADHARRAMDATQQADDDDEAQAGRGR